MSNKKQISNRKKGLTIVEVGLAIVGGIVVTILGTMAWSEVSFRLDKNELVSQVTEINAGADTWKGFKSNFTGLSMSVLCAAGQQSVSAKTCGGIGGSGTNTNAYGGNFVLAAGSNLSQKSLQITGLPSERINELADSLAPMTANQCSAASGCPSLTTSGTTITLTL
ncbi:hypothetical protein [Vibrio sp.]|uniref:hypothetical protein n=1 Tax=Vibrio sp. TaxID=678 RepID=UPI003D11523F